MFTCCSRKELEYLFYQLIFSNMSIKTVILISTIISAFQTESTANATANAIANATGIGNANAIANATANAVIVPVVTSQNLGSNGSSYTTNNYSATANANATSTVNSSNTSSTTNGSNGAVSNNGTVDYSLYLSNVALMDQLLSSTGNAATLYQLASALSAMNALNVSLDLNATCFRYYDLVTGQLISISGFISAFQNQICANVNPSSNTNGSGASNNGTNSSSGSDNGAIVAPSNTFLGASSPTTKA